MATYNILKTEIECPRCNQIEQQQIDLYFDYTNEMLEYKLGEKYLWCIGKSAQNGGRPEHGNTDGEGYVECKLCNKDFFVKVKVRNDMIELIENDPVKKPHIVD